MNVTLHINSNDISGHLISLERTEKLCKPGQEMVAEIDLNCPYDLNPWNSITIWEEGTKVYTGYVSSVGFTFGDSVPRITVQGLDTWKLATDGWNSEIYTTNDGDTVVSMLDKYLSAAGLTYSINNVMDLNMPNGSVIPYSPYAEIITDLASALGAFIRVDADGVVQIGMVIDELPDGPAISTGSNLATIDVATNDYKARNKVIVWGPKDVGVIRTDESWATVDHTMVIANPYISNAALLAARIHANVKNPEVIKTCGVLGDPARKVGQHCDITSSIFTGEDYCTTLKSRWGKSTGYAMTQIFGERCAIFGGAPVPEADGRDVIVATYGMGVWRCKDIWADTIHWEPLNTGLDTAYPDPILDIPINGGYSCDWFIRDPFECNSRAFLLTEHGVYETTSLEPGYENWVPVLTHNRLSFDYCHPYILKIRSTIAKRGQYYLVLGGKGEEFGGWGKWLAFTNDHFRTLQFKNALEKNGFDLGLDCSNSKQRMTFNPHNSRMVGIINHADDIYSIGHEGSTALSSWHHTQPYCGAGKGGLAAWHRNEHGCTATGRPSALVPSILDHEECAPGWWSGVIEPKGKDPFPCNSETFAAMTHQLSLSSAQSVIWFQPPPPINCWWVGYTVPSGACKYNDALSVYKQPTIHIPYDQNYGNGEPHTFYLIPGQWEGDAFTTTAVYPTRMSGGNLIPITNLPWGGDDCHFLQGSLGTYSPDRQKVYCFSAGKPSRFATSENECGSWTERASVPFKTSCFSGFPYSSSKIYTGRDPVRDATPEDEGDTALIYVSWDRGDTWHDVTGDLWDQTKALGLRKDGSGNNLGARGLVTIAPRYL